MSIENWVQEALRYGGKGGSTVREIQRYIDEHFYEELAVDTLEAALVRLIDKGQVQKLLDSYTLAKQEGAKDAFERLFGD